MKHPQDYRSTTPTIFDIEASGFGRGSYPIEVGVALPGEQTRCWLIRPLREWTHWDPRAARKHRISREILEAHGRPVGEVAEALNRALRGRTIYSDAWANDLSWLALLFEEAHRVQGFRLEALRGILSERQAALWTATKSDIVRELALTRHRASTDARILQLTYLRTRSLDEGTYRAL